mmetsp:Transcript_59780/g.138202  ORF Transcript_59780/g.138202 Transcript_59780/m.138202 type:complete len:228 (-) Transcript_59780:6492-7175(-)
MLTTGRPRTRTAAEPVPEVWSLPRSSCLASWGETGTRPSPRRSPPCAGACPEWLRIASPRRSPAPPGPGAACPRGATCRARARRGGLRSRPASWCTGCQTEPRRILPRRRRRFAPRAVRPWCRSRSPSSPRPPGPYSPPPPGSPPAGAQPPASLRTRRSSAPRRPPASDSTPRPRRSPGGPPGSSSAPWAPGAPPHRGRPPPRSGAASARRPAGQQGWRWRCQPGWG